jgi:hypothetical protein
MVNLALLMCERSMYAVKCTLSIYCIYICVYFIAEVKLICLIMMLLYGTVVLICHKRSEQCSRQTSWKTYICIMDVTCTDFSLEHICPTALLDSLCEAMVPHSLFAACAKSRLKL